MTEIAFNPSSEMSTEQYRQVLEDLRWYDGFRCPGCGNTKGYKLRNRRLIQCTLCRKQTSPTAGTTLHRLKNLALFFQTAELVTSNIANGISQSTSAMTRELKGHYSVIWSYRHKLTTILEKEVSGEKSFYLACESIQQALFRTSKDDYPENFSPEPEQMEMIQQNNSSIVETARRGFTLLIVRFLMSVFHGVSRKYAQKYVSEFTLKMLTPQVSVHRVIVASIRGSPIPLLIKYHSPFWLKFEYSASSIRS